MYGRQLGEWHYSFQILGVKGLSISSLCHQVVFKKAVSLKEHPKVNEWLTCVETEMRTTLATLLAAAVSDVQQFNSESIDGQQYMKWVDGYQVQRTCYLIHWFNLNVPG